LACLSQIHIKALASVALDCHQIIDCDFCVLDTIFGRRVNIEKPRKDIVSSTTDGMPEQVIGERLTENGIDWLRPRICVSRVVDKAISAVMGSRCDARYESALEGSTPMSQTLRAIVAAHSTIQFYSRSGNQAVSIKSSAPFCAGLRVIANLSH
jgi:hypothetical protein